MISRKTLFFAVLVAAALASGCSDNPTTPKATDSTGNDTLGGGGNILTPTRMVIQTFYCTRWPEKKASGAAWDPFGGNPDIYLTIGAYRSELYENWEWQTPFTAGFSKGWSLPVGNVVSLEMWDQDVSNDDLMAKSSWAPLVWYQQDNAKDFHVVDTMKDTRIEIFGYWVYE